MDKVVNEIQGAICFSDCYFYIYKKIITYLDEFFEDKVYIIHFE